MKTLNLNDPAQLAKRLRQLGIPARKEYGLPFVRLLSRDSVTGETTHSDFVFWKSRDSRSMYWLEHSPKDPADAAADPDIPVCSTGHATGAKEGLRAAVGTYRRANCYRAESLPDVTG